ncbi:hypothetical protein EBI01_08405 [Marinomonas rhizomae]|uniref:Asparagine synthase n=1 Tax=Marinomonas rhizomae TaxID=491948 RepID=A0A366J626_9GAMM|nr:asparagine synthase-related protein [Marinomonas rhizomae]RBP82483.1 asparagine synthase [Marinomonas rhizomae]RNF73726.1 hypothetical protein EBI01_08405 [Marinomonas rhizomae]
MDAISFSIKNNVSNVELDLIHEVNSKKDFAKLINNTFDNTFYMSYKNSEYIIWDSLKKLLQDVKPSLNLIFLKKHITFGESFGYETAWENVFLLLPGATITLNSKSVECIYEPWFRGQYSERNIIVQQHPVKALMESLPPLDKPVLLEFSGGTDSTSIAYAISERSNALSVTWGDPNSQNSSDINHAIRIAKKLKISHKIDLIDPNDLFLLPPREYLPDRPSVSILSMAQKDKFIKSQVSTSDLFVLNGHGGDHIFLDPPNPIVTIDLLMKGNIFSAIRYYRKISDFYGEGLLAPLRYRNVGRGIGNHRFTLTPGKYLHKRMIQQACYENSVWNNCGLSYRMVHPFTQPAMLHYAMNIAPHKFVDKYQSRFPFRQSMNQHFSTEDFSRISKGHLTGLFQQAVSQNYHYLAELLNSGVGQKYGIYRSEDMLPCLKMVAIGGASIEPALMNALAMEIFFVHWSRVLGE